MPLVQQLEALAPRAVPNLPTFAGTVPPAVAAGVPPIVESAARVDQPPIPAASAAEEPVPPLLRVARVLAVVVLAGALVSALLVWSLERFSETNEDSAGRQEKAAPVEERPSPAAPTPAPGNSNSTGARRRPA